jgi:hypothetical protein
MAERSERDVLLSAMTTEHFVLQTANNSTYTEASSRSTLYVMALSSSVVAAGFVASTELLLPFAAIVLPVLFVLGLFTVARLVETALDSIHCLRGIARIRGYYRATLGTDAAHHFSSAHGRWPETEGPALRFGPSIAFFGTTAAMIAVINNAVAGVGLALLTHLVAPSAPAWLGPAAGIAGTLLLTYLFYAYQRWRFDDDERAHQRRR